VGRGASRRTSRTTALADARDIAVLVRAGRCPSLPDRAGIDRHDRADLPPAASSSDVCDPTRPSP